MQKITMVLTFDGKAEEAMNFYTSLFEQSEILYLKRYGADQAGMEGKVMQASFILQGQEYKCLDSSVKHAFSFTPAISLFVNCSTELEIDELFLQLSKEGQIFMPLGPYPFSSKFCWIADKYGVSWQLNLQDNR